uniref:MGRN1/RNF157-like N-terminal domain-containing protein n=2 Tax=Lactuca sativa TaxID=4236 RepID=A0A9R1W4G6_LACSA|nr:hypothetical protein LSAT_V11C200051370 [Lactuca sativa]
MQKKNQTPPAATVPKPMEPAELIHWLGSGHGHLAVYTVDVRRNTVKIKSDLKDPEKYSLMFIYDAYRAGRITLRLLQLVGPNIQEMVTITKDFKKGPGQQFIHDGLSFPLYKSGYTKVYHLVIEAQVTEDGIENNILETTLASVEKVSSEIIITVNNQILSANGRKSVCHDMDGVKYSTQSDEDDPYNGCNICYNKVNPGILFPIGKLKLFEEVIAEESNGNRVYKGTYDKSSVTVERIPKVHGHVTDQVIQILKKSGQHANIVGFIAKEETENFVFFVYESCECTLHDLISSVFHDKKSNEYKVRIPSFMHLKLWKPDNNSPSECLLKLLRGIVEGIAHFDEHGIIPNLNPRRIFICKAPSGITAKVLGMGISTTGKSSFIIS